MVEGWVLFALVGAVAVIAAVMMLLSSNAIHAALWLIVNLACVAVLFLLLDAPFLAMVQIAVYAGAIMVLFLFVIMLLGAEKLMQPETQFRWLTSAAIVLAVLFLAITGGALLLDKSNLQAAPGGQPVLRIAHVATDTGPVDVYANGELIAPNVGFRQSTEFIPLPPGDYTIALRPAGVASDLVTATTTLASVPGSQATAYTAVIFGQGPLPVLNVILDDINPVDDEQSRVTIFNAYRSPINLVDYRSEFDDSDDVVLVSDLPQGGVSEPRPFNEGEARDWAFVDPSNNTVLYRLNNPNIFTVAGGTAQLVVLTMERLFDGSIRAVAQTVKVPAIPSFGGPESIGQLLFTRYLLPFEMVSVLLLVAIIGAIVLTQRDHIPAIRKRDIRRKVSRPLASVIAAQTGHDVTASEPEQPAPVGK